MPKLISQPALETGLNSDSDNALLILKKIRPTLLIERQRQKNGC
jgi:hypothetical protein